MAKRVLKKEIRIALIVVPAVLLIGTAVMKLMQSQPEPVADTQQTAETESVSTPEPTTEPVKEKKEYELDDEVLTDLRSELADDQNINSDVKCLLHFNSGLVHDPVLQTSDENYYLYKDWQTGEYLSYGSIVLDSRNHLSEDEMNTIIYGHYIYEFRNNDRTLVFTPLAQLMQEENLAANRYVSLVLPDEVRYYEIAAVYECPLETIDGVQYALYGLEYNLLNYDAEYMKLYQENIDKYKYYNIDCKFDENDRFLTLQTCIEGNDGSREIVLCRELGRTPYEEG